MLLNELQNLDSKLVESLTYTKVRDNQIRYLDKALDGIRTPLELFVMDNEVLILNYITKGLEYSLVIDAYTKQTTPTHYLINVVENNELVMYANWKGDVYND